MLRAVFTLALVLFSLPSFPQSYPARAVRIVVPFGVGGPADLYARYLGAKLQEALGHPFVVEDRPGGGAIVGTDAVAKADAGGSERDLERFVPLIRKAGIRID